MKATSIIVFLTLFMLTGCATIVSKSKYTINVKANEPGATVNVYDKNNRQIYSVITPTSLELDSSAGYFSSASYRFEFEKEGFEKDECTIKSIVDASYWQNFIWLYSAPLGLLLVDPISGAMWSFDENVPVMGYLRPVRDAVPLNVKQGSQLYNIVSCERESGETFAYRFVLDISKSEDQSAQTIQTIQGELYNMLKKGFVDAHSLADRESIDVEFPEFSLKGNRVTGRGVVLTFFVTSLSYDPETRTGKLAVKVSANQYEEARKWIRKNIETLARDKNIALTTGEIPPAAKFYLGKEELKDGNILEIEFRTE